MSIHDGHRERLRKRFKETGLHGFTEIQALELLLFYCIPRQDTNVLAHELLTRFGSFSQVLDTSPQELKKVKGVGDNVALFLKLVPALGQYYSANKAEQTKVLPNVEACGNYLLEKLKDLCNETVYLLCLDAKCKVLNCQIVGEGSVNSAAVPVRRVVEMALASNASAVVLAHNHPSGIALPSNEDILTTRRIAAALDAVEITLADHIVVADGDYVSMLQSGYYRPGECTAIL